MKKTIKLFFIASPDNTFHPHLLHTRRAVFYGAMFLVMKIIVIGFSILLPTSFFFTPDVLAAEQGKLLRLTNAFRIKKNLPYLKEKTELNSSAHLRAADMAVNQYYDHVGPHHRTLDYFLDQVNYQYEVAGENLAMGPLLAENVMIAWKRSPTHYANLVDPEYTEAGFDVQGGIFEGQPVAYAALHFGKPLSTSTSTIPLSQSSEPIPVMRASRAGLSPLDKYTWARHTDYPLTKIFDLSRGVYFLALIFFGSTLLFNIIIHIRRKHYHIIAQTLVLLSLIIVLGIV